MKQFKNIIVCVILVFVMMFLTSCMNKVSLEEYNEFLASDSASFDLSFYAKAGEKELNVENVEIEITDKVLNFDLSKMLGEKVKLTFTDSNKLLLQNKKVNFI